MGDDTVPEINKNVKGPGGPREHNRFRFSLGKPYKPVIQAQPEKEHGDSPTPR